MKIDFLFWDVSRFTGGKFSLGWNWGWGYYRALKDMGMAGYGGTLDKYSHTNSQVVIITDGIQISMRDNPKATEKFFAEIKRRGQKLVIIMYESLFANDNLLTDLPGGNRKDFMHYLHNNHKWNAMVKHADLMVFADPHDVHTIHNNPKFKHYPKTIYLPLAVDEKVIVPQPVRVWKSCFIGSLWVANRKKIIHPVLSSGLLEVPQIFHKGNNWTEAINSTKTYNQIAGKYAINLNIRTLFSGLQLRIFETMAMGRVCVSHKPTDAAGRTDLWKDLENVVWYDNDSQIVPTLKDCFSNKKKLVHIGGMARREIMSKHTHTHRIKSILASL